MTKTAFFNTSTVIRIVKNSGSNWAIPQFCSATLLQGVTCLIQREVQVLYNQIYTLWNHHYHLPLSYSSSSCSTKIRRVMILGRFLNTMNMHLVDRPYLSFWLSSHINAVHSFAGYQARTPVPSGNCTMVNLTPGGGSRFGDPDPWGDCHIQYMENLTIFIVGIVAETIDFALAATRERQYFLDRIAQKNPQNTKTLKFFISLFTTASSQL